MIEEIRAWAASRPDIIGLALVGSHARGTQRPDSDIDLVLLCTKPLEEDWFRRFGEVRSVERESYGAVQAIRVVYESGFEVEFGIAGPDWARLPLDPGTARVIAGGMRILHDPAGLLRAAAVPGS